MASYAIFLASGNNILSTSLRCGTIKLYVNAAAKLFMDRDEWNPTHDKKGETASALQKVYHEAKRWEEVPNRAEPLSPQMVKFLCDRAKNSPPDSSESAIVDWAVLGLHGGFRISEYAQSSSSISFTVDIHNKTAKNIDGSVKAFTADDFSFFTEQGSRCPIKEEKMINEIKTGDVRFRFQKNNDNGQEITFARNNTNITFCPVRAMLRICERAKRLNQSDSAPLAVCLAPKRSKKGKKDNRTVSYITSALVARDIKYAARKAHGIKNKKDLAKFTTHSVRVGACTLLHVTGKSPDYIKQRLRWRSDAYQVYLRNLPILAEQHSELMNAFV